MIFKNLFLSSLLLCIFPPLTFAESSNCHFDLVSSLRTSGKSYQAYKEGRPLSAIDFWKSQKGEPVKYALWSDGSLEILHPSDLNFANNLSSDWIIINPKRTKILLEIGDIRHDPKSNSFTFSPSSKISTKNSRIAAWLEKEQKKLEIYEFSSPQKVLQCQKILSEGWSGKKFVSNRVLYDNLLLTGVLATTSPNPFTTEGHEDFVLNQYVVANTHALLMSLASRKLILSGWSAGSQLFARFAVLTTSNRIQTGISSVILGHHPNLGSPSQRAQAIQEFNDIWNFFSLGKGYLMDMLILKSIPNLAFNLCLKNLNIAAMAFGPASITFIDRAGNWYLYMLFLRSYTHE